MIGRCHLPLALRTDVTFDVVQDSDEDQKPQPVFVYRHITGGEFEGMMELLYGIDEDEGQAADIMKLYDAAAVGLVSWRHMVADGNEIAFDPARLKDIVGPFEIRELLTKALNKRKPSEDDLKNSESPYSSEQENSAKSAATAA